MSLQMLQVKQKKHGTLKEIIGKLKTVTNQLPKLIKHNDEQIS